MRTTDDDSVIKEIFGRVQNVLKTLSDGLVSVNNAMNSNSQRAFDKIFDLENRVEELERRLPK